MYSGELADGLSTSFCCLSNVYVFTEKRKINFYFHLQIEMKPPPPAGEMARKKRRSMVFTVTDVSADGSKKRPRNMEDGKEMNEVRMVGMRVGKVKAPEDPHLKVDAKKFSRTGRTDKTKKLASLNDDKQPKKKKQKKNNLDNKPAASKNVDLFFNEEVDLADISGKEY